MLTKFRILSSLHNDEPFCGLWLQYKLTGRFAAFGPIVNWWAASRPLTFLINDKPLCGLWPQYKLPGPFAALFQYPVHFRNLVNLPYVGTTYSTVTFGGSEYVRLFCLRSNNYLRCRLTYRVNALNIGSILSTGSRLLNIMMSHSAAFPHIKNWWAALQPISDI